MVDESLRDDTKRMDSFKELDAKVSPDVGRRPVCACDHQGTLNGAAGTAREHSAFENTLQGLGATIWSLASILVFKLSLRWPPRLHLVLRWGETEQHRCLERCAIEGGVRAPKHLGAGHGPVGVDEESQEH